MESNRIGRRISRFREKRDMSTLELARQIGKSQATVSRIENGKQSASVRMLGALAKALKVHPFALLSDDPLWHSVLLPARGASRLEGPARLLAWYLAEARRRKKMSLEEAARPLELSPSELEAMEYGFSLPDGEMLDRMADLYGRPRDEWAMLRRLEVEQPGLTARLAQLFQIVARVSKWMADGVEPSVRERSAMRRALGQAVDLADEPRAGYYSFGHLSDRLLRCLQNADFHRKAEELADEWERAHGFGSSAGEVLASVQGAFNPALPVARDARAHALVERFAALAAPQPSESPLVPSAAQSSAAPATE